MSEVKVWKGEWDWYEGHANQWWDLELTPDSIDDMDQAKKPPPMIVVQNTPENIEAIKGSVHRKCYPENEWPKSLSINYHKGISDGIEAVLTVLGLDGGAG